MEVIRRGVFETNSSSSHSVSIKHGDYVPEKLYVEDGICKIYPGEFGWEEFDYNDAATKAAYCLTYVKMFEEEETEPLSMMLREVIAEVTGADVEFVAEDGSSWGYIDHQSSDVWRAACGDAFRNKKALKAFIFNSRSVLTTNNDNN